MWSRVRLGELGSPISLFSGLKDFKTMDELTLPLFLTPLALLFGSKNLVWLMHAVLELEGFDVPAVL